MTLLSTPYLLLLVAVTLIFALYSQRRKRVALPDLPWINRDRNLWFSKVRARFHTTLNQKDAIRYAYNEYSGKSKSCILPTLAEDMILLPAESVDWIISQPDSALSSIDVLTTQLQTQYTFSQPHIVKNTTHHATITGDLTRQLASLTLPIFEEISDSFDESWGTDTVNWKEVCVFETLMRIVARTSNRVFVGAPMCRNEDLLKHVSGWSQAVPMASTILRQLPQPIKPILGPLLSLPAYRHYSAYARTLRPEILRRQNNYAGVEKGNKPNDFLQWQIDRGAALGIPIESDPDTITARLLATNFAAIHTSTFSITQTIFDLAASSTEVVEALREESTTALAATGDQWSKATLQLLFKHDSALRESTRLGSFLSVGIVRRVIAPEGLMAPNGTLCPYDSWIGIASNGVHNDPAIYPESDTYKPFRFSDMRQDEAKTDTKGEDDATIPKGTDRDALIKKANLSFVSVSPQYHPFGYGRHACPGRFFAANELKVLLAYMLRNYDFQFLETRPPSQWMGPVLIPPQKATIRVRRRAK